MRKELGAKQKLLSSDLGEFSKLSNSALSDKHNEEKSVKLKTLIRIKRDNVKKTVLDWHILGVL